MTAVNIPDMYQIVKEHGLVPVPLEINLDNMAPISFDAIKELVNEKVEYIDVRIKLILIDQSHSVCLFVWYNL